MASIDQTFGRTIRLVLSVLVAAAFLVAPAIAAPKTVLVFGNSLVAGLGLSDRDGFVAQIQAALNAAHVEVTLINGGVSGDTTATALDRLDWALGDKPDGVLLELGANDMLQGVPVETIQSNLDAIMAKLAEQRVPVFIAGMQANRALGDDYVKAFDAMYPLLAKKYGATLYPFYLDGVALDPKLNQADLIHPNAEGVKKIVANIVPTFSVWANQLILRPIG